MLLYKKLLLMTFGTTLVSLLYQSVAELGFDFQQERVFLCSFVANSTLSDECLKGLCGW